MEKKPGNKDLIRDMAEVLYKQKQYDKSLSYCQKLMEIDHEGWQSTVPGGTKFSEEREKKTVDSKCATKP